MSITDATPAPARPRRRWLRVLGVVGALCLSAAGFLAWTVTHLESPAIKRRIVGAAATAGINLDYSGLSVTPRGVHLTGLRVLQSAPDASGPPLIAIDRLDLRVHPWTTILTRRAAVAVSAIDGVHVTLYMDEDGSSSITRLLKALPPSPPKPATPTKPLSQLLGLLDDVPVDVEAFQLGRVEATVVKRSKAGVATTHYSGLELSLSASKGAMEVALDTPTDGAQLDISGPQGHQHLLADTHLKLAWRSQRGELSLDASLRKQDFLALPSHAPPVEHLVSLHATIVPTPAKHLSLVTLDSLRLLGKAGSGTATVELIDGPSGSLIPFIRQAALNLTLDGLHGFLPDSFGVLHELSGHVNLRAAGIEIDGAVPKVGAEGGADVEADLARLAFSDGIKTVELTKLDLKASLKPAMDGFDADATLQLGSAQAATGAKKVGLGRSRTEAKLHVTAAQHVTGLVTGTFDRLELSGAPTLSLKDAELRVEVKDGALIAGGVLPVSGAITTGMTVHELAAENHGLHVAAASLKLQAPLHLAVNGGSVESHVDATALEVRQGTRVLLASTGLTLVLHAPKFMIDGATATRSTGSATVDLTVGGITAMAKVDKRLRDLDYELTTRLPSLALVRPFVPSSLPVPWDKVGVSVMSKGSVVNVLAGSAAQISQETTLQIENGAFHGKPVDVAAALLTTHLVSHGTLAHHIVDAEIHAAGLVLQKEALAGDENTTLHLEFDQTQPSLMLHFQMDGTALPEGHLDLTSSYDKAQQRLIWKTDGELHHLDVVSGFLPEDSPAANLDFTTLTLALNGSGNADGLVSRFKGFAPILAEKPMRMVRGRQGLDVTVHGLLYEDDDGQTLDLPLLTLHLAAEEKEEGRHADVTVTVPKGEIDASEHVIKFEGLKPALTVDLKDDSVRARFQLGVGTLTQDAYARYPVSDLKLDLQANAGPDGTLHIESFRSSNPITGESITASGTVESVVQFEDGIPHLKPHFWGAAGDHHGAQISGEIVQQLEALPAGLPLQGRGVARIPFVVDSADFRTMRATATKGITFEHADIELPDYGIAVTNLNAHIPVQLKFRFTDDGPIILRGVKPGVYSRARFTDYQPFLGQENYVTMDSFRLGSQVVGPIAGNLRMDRNLIALDQMEMTAYGGKIAGQLILDMNIDLTTFGIELKDVRFRGNLANLAPASRNARQSDVVDANAALRFHPDSLSLDGRIEIVRIGREDLNAILDTWDPNHSEISANQAREIVKVGYPKDVSLTFHEGFTVIKIAMGGFAGAAEIEPMQLTTGPLLQKYVVPTLERLMRKKKP